jgi:hypothetical protein
MIRAISGWVSGGFYVKKILVAALAAMMLSGCIFDEEAWDFHDTKLNAEQGQDK